MTDSLHLEAAERSPKVALAGVAVGAVAVAFGLYLDPRRTWLNLLLNGFYFLSLSVSATFFIASQLMTGARWSASLRRIPEALMLLWPVGAVPMLALFFGRRWIYEWSFDRTFAGEPGAEGRALYLKTPFFFGRMAIAIALWALFAWLFRKTSLEQDGDRRQSL